MLKCVNFCFLFLFFLSFLFFIFLFFCLFWFLNNISTKQIGLPKIRIIFLVEKIENQKQGSNLQKVSNSEAYFEIYHNLKFRNRNFLSRLKEFFLTPSHKNKGE